MSRRIILGTAGHIDHGKTTLIKALTGIDTDRLKEEKKRGITIELGFAHLTLNDGQRIGIVDVPGHERFVRNMVAGATGVDLVALVIAADEGVMPQTREHVDICELLGITTGVVVLTKVDMVEADWLELVTEDVKAYLTGTFLKEAPLVAVSAHTGQGLDEFKAVLTQIAARLSERRESGPFRLPVDRVFTMKGFGTVVTGTSLSGRVKVGEMMRVYPSGLRAKVRGLQVHGGEVEEASSGLRTAINLQGLDRAELARGDVVATPDSLLPATRFDAKLKLLASAPRKLKNRAEVHFHIGTSEFMARVILMDSETLEPGRESYVQIITEDEAVCLPGDHYVIRASSPQVTIGGGRILNVAPPRRKRFDPLAQEVFRVMESGRADEKTAWLVKESRLLGLTKGEIKARSALTERELDRILNELMSRQVVVRFDAEAQKLVHADHLQEMMAAIEAFLADYHRANPLKPGLPKEELKTRIKLHADPKLVTFAASRLIAEGKARAQEDLIALADHKVSLASDLTEIKANILAAYRQGGLTPPRYREVADKLGGDGVSDVMALLLKEGSLVKLKEDLFYDPEALEGLKKRVVEFLQSHGEMTTQDFKELAGVSRKYLIPLAEYYDRQGVTIRVGEVRKLRERLG